MAEDINFKNVRISNFRGFVILTLDWVTWRTVMHHSSTSICMPISCDNNNNGSGSSSSSSTHVNDDENRNLPEMISRLFAVASILKG